MLWRVAGLSVSLVVASCTSVDLSPIGDPHGGTTLPGPDMTKVTFSHSQASALVVISGTRDAVPAMAQIDARNLRSFTENSTVADHLGAFILPLSATILGDTVELVVEVDGERSEGDNLLLVGNGGDLPAVLEVMAIDFPESPGVVVVAGQVNTVNEDHMVRVANQDNGVILNVPLDERVGEERTFEAALGGDVGQLLHLWVFEEGVATSGAPLSTVVVVEP